MYSYFSYFSKKTYVVDTHKKHLTEALLMSTHNICFLREIRKMSIFGLDKWTLTIFLSVDK